MSVSVVDESTEKSLLSRRSLLRTAGVASAAGGLTRQRPAGAASLSGSGPFMRTPDRARSVAARGVPSLPPAAIVALNRMGFGPRPGDVAAFNALAATEEGRMAAYVTQQLDPGGISDTLLDSRMTAANFESIGIMANPDNYLATLWDWYINDNAPSGNTSSNVPHDELIQATFVRALFSKKQLVEVLADFWHNHFNVHIDNSSFIRATLAHLDLVIRQHLLGNFRNLLEAVTRSTAMLYFLDNYTSSNGGPNENHSRELFELHTLGAENYFGVLPQNAVPQVDGRPAGYVDADVFEATRCFTGWSFSFGSEGDGDTGLFYYRPSWHDRFQKNVLGVHIPQDQPDMKDGQDVLTALASHPGTGRHIARKLCRRLIADDPPQSVVDAAADVFTTQWQAPNQLKQVYQTILLSDEFRNTWGEKIKRPFEVAVSALRACNSLFTPRDDSDTDNFMWRYNATGQEPFHWPAPDGFPDVRSAWTSMTPRVMSWRLCNWLIDFQNSSGNYYCDVVNTTPSTVRSANALATWWTLNLLGRSMDGSDLQEIVEFMAQGINPDFDLNLDDSDTRDRLRSMVGLILMSPDFLWR